MTSLDDIKSKRLQSAAVVVEVDDVGFGVFGQTKVFGKSIGIVGGGAQEGKYVDRDALFGQGARPFADVNAAFPTSIGAIADQKNAFAVLRIVGKQLWAAQQHRRKGVVPSGIKNRNLLRKSTRLMPPA